MDNKQCKKCGESKELGAFPKQRAVCRPCHNENTRAIKTAYRERNIEKHYAYNRQHQQIRRDYYAAWASNHRAKKLKATPSWDIELTEFVVEEAHHLRGLRDALFPFTWHVDHIIPLKGKRVSGLHVWNNLQVIPATENLRKNNTYAVHD